MSAPVRQHFCKFCRLSTCCYSGTLPARKLYCVMITYIVPVCMVIILLSSFLLDLSFESHHFAAGWRLSAPVRQHFCKFCRLSTCCHSGTLPARKLYCVIPYIVPVCMVIILLSSFLLDLSFDSHHFAAGWRLSAPIWQHFCKFCSFFGFRIVFLERLCYNKKDRLYLVLVQTETERNVKNAYHRTTAAKCRTLSR